MNSKLTLKAMAIGALLAGTTGANGALISYTVPVSPASFGPSTFALSGSVLIPNFNIGLGTLVSVRYDLSGTVDGTAKVENISETASSVVTEIGVKGDFKLLSPVDGTTQLLLVGATATTTTSLATFDGTNDKGGPSGDTLPVSDTASDWDTSVNGALLALLSDGSPDSAWFYSGIGSTTLDATGGELVTQFVSQGSGSISVTYTYDDGVTEVPEASTWAAMLPMIGVAGWAFRRSRTAKAA